MTIQPLFKRSTALAALFALPIGFLPAAAQESDSTQGQSMAEKIEQADAPDTAETDTAMTESLETHAVMDSPNAVIATVGDAEILGSDVTRVIGMLPPTMRQQPDKLLLSAALQQLVLRELILDRARSESLAEDPTFASLSEQASAEAVENITMQFWLQREMANAVTDEAVNAAYEEFTQSAQGDVPPLDAIRPQIEQELRRRGMDRIRADLQAKGPEITFASKG